MFAKKFMPLLFAALAMLLAGRAMADFPEIPEVDRDEVLRRGNSVQYVGGDSRYASDPYLIAKESFAQVMALPKNDADKWFISVLSIDGCAACERLKAQWRTDQYLQALAHPGEPAKSWANYSEYNLSTRQDKEHFSAIKVRTFPTIIVQPPKSGKYGSPATVVFQGTPEGSPQDLVERIKDAVRKFAASKDSRKSFGEVQGGFNSDPLFSPGYSETGPPSINEPAYSGANQPARPTEASPGSVVQTVNVFGASRPRPRPSPQPKPDNDPIFPDDDDSDNDSPFFDDPEIPPRDFLFPNIRKLIGGVGSLFHSAIIVLGVGALGYLIFLGIRKIKRAMGKPLVISDASLDAILAKLKAGLDPTATKPPA